MSNIENTFLKDKINEHDLDYLSKKYDEVKNSEENYALALINIKNFRYFNTKYGIEAGNEILQMIFERILTVLEDDEYGARLHADNFVIILKYKDENQLIYDRMMILIDKVYRITDERIYRNLFISMGLYAIANDETSIYDALNCANLCRKECKGLFRRSSSMELYDEGFREKYMNRLQLEVDTADAYKNYDFVTYLQPKIDLKTDKIVGAEALLRWFDKDGKPIPLNSFLPILNQNGYIEIIDLDMFEQMCQRLALRIKNNQKVLPISFNISKASFYDLDMLKSYRDVMTKYEVPGHLLEIELMESISLDDTERMKEVIAEFKKCGFTCSLDDFGNGYSSFNVLLNAELDIVKMDRQFFVENLNGDSKLVIKTIVDLIHSLNMSVVAEGVETKEHIDYLKSCGCDFAQGYYYYKPMPIDEFEALIEAQI